MKVYYSVIMLMIVEFKVSNVYLCNKNVKHEKCSKVFVL